MSIRTLLVHRYQRVPADVIDRILMKAKTRATADFDVYAIASPVVIRIDAAYALLERITARILTVHHCKDCKVCGQVEQIIHEEIDAIVTKLTDDAT